MSRRPTVPTPEQVTDALDALGDVVVRLTRRGPDLARRATYELVDGYSSASGAIAPTGGIGDPVAAAVVAREGRLSDPVRAICADLWSYLYDAQRALDAAWSAVQRAEAIQLEEERQRRASSLQPCANPRCDDGGGRPVAVTGIGDDRLKEGRCPRCYKHRYRMRTRGHDLDWPARPGGEHLSEAA